ncbi:MAG: 50S ribosomal protein L9 [Nitrospirales bacterium]|nr:50S ribosomal protein L9 [Nitrospira sp.]MDR4503088.1 50S ribosomal protein L9 [Nitrospirales bacterium]
MKVILKEDVDGLGYLGDLLTVADGYARNYLIPRKKAILANPRNIKAFEHLKRVATHQLKKELQGLGELGKRIASVSMTFEVQTGKDDKLFGSVTSKDIGERLSQEGIEIDRRKISLAQPIKELGTYAVPVKLHREVVPEVSVTVVKKGGEEPVQDEIDLAEDSPQSESE